jgi:hypothetical protein
MPNQFLTIKDIAALDRLTHPDSVGLVDNIVNVVPELDVVLGRPISGISYEATILTAIGSNGGFRKINSGNPFSSMSIDEKRFNCFPWDAPFSVDEALLIKKAAAGEAPAEALETFATSGARQKALDMSAQFYLGSLADPLGPPGLMDFLVTQRTQVDSRTGLKIDQVIDAGGTTAGKCEVIWFIKQGPQGVHWLFGNGRGIIMNPWVRLPGMPSPDSTPQNPRYSTQWRSNMFGYIGTSMAQYHAVGAIINVDVTNGTIYNQTGTANGLWNDTAVADLFAKWPISMKPDLCLCTQNAAAMLQKARTVTNFVSGERGWTTGSAPIANFPTHLPTMGNIPIVVTDGIKRGNQVVL